MKPTTGRAWVFGDNIDTDVLAPGAYMKLPPEQMVRHCLESVRPEFAGDARPGDVVVGGENFGMGSSREQAALVLKILGISAVLAPSFARIFYRNALNLGLPAMVLANAGTIEDGDRLTVDLATGTVVNANRAATLTFAPFPPHLAQMIADGGLMAQLKKQLKSRRGQ